MSVPAAPACRMAAVWTRLMSSTASAPQVTPDYPQFPLGRMGRSPMFLSGCCWTGEQEPLLGLGGMFSCVLQ